MKQYFITTLLLTTSLGLSSPALAGEDSDIWSGVLSTFQGAPKWGNSDGNYLKLRGRLLADYAYLEESFSFRGFNRQFDISDVEIRAGRLGVEGRYSKFKYKAEVDFAGGGDPVAKAVNVTWQNDDVVPFYVKVGQMKAGNTMEEATSSLHSTFIERGMITDAVGFDRRIGVELGKAGKNYSLMAGIYGQSVNGMIDGGASTNVMAARATYAPILEKDKLVHIGAFYRRTEDESGAPKRAARWGPHLGSTYVRPIIGNGANLYGAELGLVLGPLHGQAEYIEEKGTLGRVNGGFVQAGYFITGETRKYKAGSGKFDRTKPLRPLSKGGLGGWEVAARFDTVDEQGSGPLNRQQKVDTWTLGLTWYPESHVRVKLNYSDADAGIFSAKGLYTRLQIDW